MSLREPVARQRDWLRPLPLERVFGTLGRAAGRRPAQPGCIKLRFPGRGQPVLGGVGLESRGQAVPTPFRRAFEVELDAPLQAQQPIKTSLYNGTREG
jgi:hypothetical protein